MMLAHPIDRSEGTSREKEQDNSIQEII